MCIYINLRKHSANCGGGARAHAHIDTNTHTHTHTHTQAATSASTLVAAAAAARTASILRSCALKPSRSGWIHASASSLPVYVLYY